MSQDALAFANKIINTIDVVLGYWDRELRCQFANTSCAMWFGRSPHDISLEELLGPLYESSLPYIRGALNGEAQAFECDILLPDGSIRHGLASYYPDIVDGTVAGFSVHLVNITKTRRLEFALEDCNRRARLLASHDFLTGLANRYLLIDRISELILTAASSGELVGLVSMDINGFNAINETYGYDAGDALIKEIARRMKSAILSTDTVVRMSGDEFLLLVTGIRVALEINAAIDRLLRNVQRPLHFTQMSLAPTLSYGIAIYPLNASQPSELLQIADKARRDAKRLGRRHRSVV
jgi:diguanylate cyclase (GGDEF)-like protein